MKKRKIITAFLLTLVILSSSISVAQQAIIKPKNIDVNDEIIDDLPQLKKANNTTYGFSTFGPRKFTITKLTVQNGSFSSKILFFNNLLMTLMLRASLIFTWPLLRPTVKMVWPETGKVDFTIEYKRDLALGLLSRNRYFTMIDEMIDGNTTNNSIEIWGEKHTVKVEGFYGVFMKTKSNFLTAPYYMIIGICDKYTLIQ